MLDQLEAGDKGVADAVDVHVGDMKYFCAGGLVCWVFGVGEAGQFADERFGVVAAFWVGQQIDSSG